MLRTTLAKAYLKRTIRPLYGWTQTTPKAMYLDPAWDRSVAIWPGMVAMRTSGDNTTLINATGSPYGLFGNYIGGDSIDEPLDAGVNAIGVWVLGPDAEFEILDPAFDSSLGTWVDPGDGTNLLVHAYATTAKRGMLCPAGTANATARPVARLLKVNSAKKITIGGLAASLA
jgi:hypothetical protein